MLPQPWLMMSILVLLILFFIIFLFISRKNKRPPDYYALFVIGLSWMAIGLPLENHILFIMGVLFTAIGLINKDRWKKNSITWEKLKKEEKIVKGFLVFGLTVFVVVGLIVFYLAEKGVL
jgi:hypothetical protein